MKFSFKRLSLTFILGLLTLTSSFFSHAKVCNHYLLEVVSEPHKLALSTVDFPDEGHFYTFERILRIALYDAYGGRDFYTGERLDFDLMSIDHILPRSLGGPDNIWNFVPTTGYYNSRKGSQFTTQNIEHLKYIAEHFVPRVMLNLRLYGAFDNREEDLKKATEAFRKRQSYRLSKKMSNSSEAASTFVKPKSAPLVARADVGSLVLKPTVFRRTVDKPTGGMVELLYHFSKQLSELDEKSYQTAMSHKIFQFEIDYKDLSENVINDEPMAYSVYLSYRRNGDRINEESFALEASLFEVSEYNYNRKTGKIEVEINFHPNFAIKMLQAPSSQEDSLVYISEFFRPVDITREEFIYWTE